ncbi:superoxide dismutase, Ni [bacterium]|nr:superoxide dismutase, Ni [bacterium]
MKNVLISALISVIFVPVLVSAHCEIPCGIYGDEMRFDMITEHIATIEKSMTMITKLSAEKEIDYNQLIRWVDNKETHADHIQEIVTQYFLTQRVKPVDKTDKVKLENYQQQLELCHHLLLLSMKTKQSTDNEIIHKLESTMDNFWKTYFGPDIERHSH